MRRSWLVALVLAAVMLAGGCGSGGGSSAPDDESSGASLISDAEALAAACRERVEGDGSELCTDLDGIDDLCAALDPSLSGDGVLVTSPQSPQPETVECRGDDTVVHVAFLGENAQNPCDAGVDCTDEVDGVEIGTVGGRTFVFVKDEVVVDVAGDDVAALATAVANAAFGIEVSL